mmetsp:Transcript_146056/g.406923  ORF Transcript_146056/g.406923 Transcript_146056/m.406923 type:complete len:232 (-) Transcript_146056:185-880(-)
MTHQVQCEAASEECPQELRPAVAEAEEHALEGEAEQAEPSPKAGRRRRRRRHRRAAASTACGHARDSSDDESGPSQGSAGSAAGGASPHRNVVTWSDLGGEGVLRKALPPGRVMHSASQQQQPLPAPPLQRQCTAFAAVAFAAPAVQIWPAPWPPCTRGATSSQGLLGVAPEPGSASQPSSSNAPVPASRWTGQDTDELRQWLCKGFTGGMPGLPELAEVLQALAQEAYED